MRKKNIVFIGGILLIVFLAFLPVIIRNWPEKEPDTEIASSDTQQGTEETEMGTENDSQITEDTEEEIVIENPVSPDIVWVSSSYRGLDGGEYLSIENNQVVVNTMDFTNHEAEFTTDNGAAKVLFKWTIYNDDMVVVSETEEWECLTIDGNMDPIVLLHTDEAGTVLEMYLYSITLNSLVPFLNGAVPVDDVVGVVVSRQLDGALLITKDNVLFTYYEVGGQKYYKRTGELSKERPIYVNGGIVSVIESAAENVLSWQMYGNRLSDGYKNHQASFTYRISEVSRTWNPALYEGGYVIGVRDGKFQGIQVTEPGTRIDFSLKAKDCLMLEDVNERYLFCYQKDGHWHIADKSTGHLVTSSQNPIDIVDCKDISFVEDQDGTLYAQATREGNGIEFYNLNYVMGEDPVFDEQDKEEIVFVYDEPEFEMSKVYLWDEYFVIQNGELSIQPYNYKQVILTVPYPKENFQIAFRWAYIDNRLFAQSESLFTSDYPNETDEGFWGMSQVCVNNDIVELYYRSWLSAPDAVWFYSVSRNEVVRKIEVDNKMGVLWAILLEDAHQAVLCTNSMLYVYTDTEIIEIELGEIAGSDWRKLAMLVDGNVLLYAYNGATNKHATYLYDPISQKLEQKLKPMSVNKLEESFNLSLEILQGGYALGKVDSPCDILNLAQGTRVEAQIDIEQYKDVLDLDKDTLLFLKYNGHWCIVDKDTGEVVQKSQEAINYGNINGGVKICISEEGEAYLYAYSSRGEVDYYAFYDLGYKINK